MSISEERHATLRSRLERLDDATLAGWMEAARQPRGWGRHSVVEVDGVDVFAKAVPLTAREHANAYSTENLYELPLFYQYGVGSAGFGVFRELAVHTKTTEWVLSGATDAFPLMYHHRILPAPARRETMSASKLDGYVAYWNGSQAVRTYMTERMAARHELVLFLEYVPSILHDWFADHLDQAPRVAADLLKTAAFLRSRGVVHFDAHAHNILTDGERFVLADFGLALDPEMELSPDERAFLERHRHFDAGEALCFMSNPLRAAAEGWSAATKERIAERCGGVDVVALLGHLEALRADGHVALPDACADTILRYREVMVTMLTFFEELRARATKDAVFDDALMGRLLAAA